MVVFVPLYLNAKIVNSHQIAKLRAIFFQENIIIITPFVDKFIYFIDKLALLQSYHYQPSVANIAPKNRYDINIFRYKKAIERMSDSLNFQVLCDCYIVLIDSAFTSRLTLVTKPCNTLPGPTSVNSAKPSASIFSTICVQRTGAVSCAMRFFLISSASV